VNSPRGVVFSTAGTGFQTSANAAVGSIEFDNINPGYSGIFQTFSPQRLFTSLNSNIFDVNFFVPGSTTAALTRGFGAVFTDVDLTNTTSITLFDANNASLGTFFAQTSNTGLSFLGISYASSVISRVRVTMGNAALGAGVNDSNGNPIDLVVADDFIFAEPVPEPVTVLVLGAGALTLLKRRRKVS
jgi:hypothetical protein